VHIDDVPRKLQVRILVTLVQHDKEQIEPAHDRRAHCHVSPQAGLAIIPPANGISSRKDRRACIERGLDASFGDGDGLLFHCLMDRHLVRDVHLVELVNRTDTVIGQHQCTGFNCEFPGFFVFNDRGGETRRGGCFAGGVDCPWKEGTDVPGRVLESTEIGYRIYLLEEL